jgi:diketogulonate reductase-like aldo/keto reductase
LLGVSNVSLKQLQLLCREAQVRPSFVQNRCFAVLGWDWQVRQYCAENGLVYQGFSLLTANPEALAHPELIQIANRQAMSPAQAIFCFALHVGMVPLTGTSDPEHMRSDLETLEMELTADEIVRIERLVAR